MDRLHNLPGSDFLPANPARLSAEQKRMRQPAYEMDEQRRDLVLAALKEAPFHKGWKLPAAHVRRYHVHVVVGAPEDPDKVLIHFKCYASRALNNARIDNRGRTRWSRHGSTRYLWKPEDVRAAIEYVVRGQGEAMAVWESHEPIC